MPCREFGATFTLVPQTVIEIGALLWKIAAADAEWIFPWRFGAPGRAAAPVCGGLGGFSLPKLNLGHFLSQ